MNQRYLIDCFDCECFYSNWDEEVQKTMDEQAPGEECSQSQDTLAPSPCPVRVPCGKRIRKDTE